MESIHYMMIGYLVIWALAFGLMINTWLKSRKIEQKLEAVRALVRESKDKTR